MPNIDRDRGPARLYPSGLAGSRDAQEASTSRPATIRETGDPFLVRAKENVDPRKFTNIQDYRNALLAEADRAELATAQSARYEAEHRRELIYKGRRALSDIPWSDRYPTDDEAYERGLEIERNIPDWGC
jgi:hypothetical protein